MLPTLLELGTFRLHSFGVLVALGFAAGVWWCVREARRTGVSKEKMLDLTFWLLVAGVLGSRLLFVIVNWHEYAAFFGERREELGTASALLVTFIESLAVWKGGIVWYGGLLAAFGFGALYMRRHDLPVWATSDLVAPGVMLGLAIGRLGCLAAGDDYGKVVAGAWAAMQEGGDPPWWTIQFTNPQSLVPDELLGMPLYPTQIMMSLSALAVFFALVWLRRRKRFAGQVVLAMFMLYAVSRFVIEIFRGDESRGFLFQDWLSTSQLLALLTFVLALVVYLRRSRRVEGTTSTQA